MVEEFLLLDIALDLLLLIGFGVFIWAIRKVSYAVTEATKTQALIQDALAEIKRALEDSNDKEME